MLFRFRFKLLNCVVDGGAVVDVIVDIGVMDMKLEMAAAEEVLPPMIGRLGCGAGCSGAAMVSLAMTAAASGPKASTHEDKDAAGAGAAVVAYVGVEAGVVAGAAGEQDIEKGSQAALVVVVGATVFPALDNDEPQNKSSKPPPVLLLLVVAVVVVIAGSTCAAAAGGAENKSLSGGAAATAVLLLKLSFVVVVVVSSLPKSSKAAAAAAKAVADAPDTEDGGVAKDGDR